MRATQIDVTTCLRGSPGPASPDRKDRRLIRNGIRLALRGRGRSRNRRGLRALVVTIVKRASARPFRPRRRRARLLGRPRRSRRTAPAPKVLNLLLLISLAGIGHRGRIDPS